MIKAHRSDGQPCIPDFLKLEPDEQHKQYEAFKTKLVDVLKPTPDTVAEISSNPLLAAGT